MRKYKTLQQDRSRTENTQIDFHVHSKYSFDSLSKPEKIIKVAKRKGLSAVAITDHNTIKGGVETSKLNKFNEDFTIIIGTEIRTTIGDLIGIFLNEEIGNRDFFEVVDEIKDQGGISILPHPYRGHIIDEEIIKYVDAIEVFNARMRNNMLNKKAQELAKIFNRSTSAGSDAHFTSEIGNGKVIFPQTNLDAEEIRTKLLKREVGVAGRVLPFPQYVLYEFIIGQGIRYIKQRKI